MTRSVRRRWPITSVTAALGTAALGYVLIAPQAPDAPLFPEDPEGLEGALTYLDSHSVPAQPWYLRLLMALGTWVGVGLILALLFSTGFIEYIAEHSPTRLLFGVGFLVLASRFPRWVRRRTTSVHWRAGR